MVYVCEKYCLHTHTLIITIGTHMIRTHRGLPGMPIFSAQFFLYMCMCMYNGMQLVHVHVYSHTAHVHLSHVHHNTYIICSVQRILLAPVGPVITLEMMIFL